MILITIFIVVVAISFWLLKYRFERIVKSRKLRYLKKYPLVSIIIPAYKSGLFIKNTFDSIRDSDYENKEVIVISDSKDETKDLCKEYGFRYIQNKRRMGKAFSLNRAATYAKGRYFLFLDSDTILNRGTLKTLVTSSENYKHEGEKIGIMAPEYKALNKNNLVSRLSDMEQSIHQSLLKVQMNFKSILSARGCCLLVDKIAFNKVSGFTNTLLEDGDFTARIFENGYRIKYEPNATVKTREPDTFKDMIKTKKRYGKGSLFCILNHKKTFGCTIQSFVSFYPHLIIILTFIATLIFHDPLSSAAMLLILSTFSVTSMTTQLALILSIGILSIAGIVGGASLSSGLAKTASFNITLAFLAVFLPISIAMYMKGAYLGIRDRVYHRPEMDFGLW